MVVVLKDLQKKHTSTDNFYFGPLESSRVAAIHLNRKRRNFFFTFTDLTGAVLKSFSAGVFVAKRKKRSSVQVAELMIRKLSLIAKFYRVENVRLFLKFAKRHLISAAVRTLKSAGITVAFAVDLVPVPHNGRRSKKTRRL